MKRILFVGDDDNIVYGLRENFESSGLTVQAAQSTAINNLLSTDDSSKNLLLIVVDNNPREKIALISELRERYKWLFVLVIVRNKSHNAAFYDAGADIVMNDELYWDPLLAQIRSILRRISYNRILVHQKPTPFKFDILELNPFSFPYGGHIFKDYTVFKIFHPDAHELYLELYESYNKDKPLRFRMLKNEQNDWGLILSMNLENWNYGFKAVIDGKEQNELIADPYAKYLTTINNHLQHPKAKLIKSNYKWSESKKWVSPSDPRDLIIYELHIKDLVGRVSDGESVYKSFIKEGIPYIKSLGVNAIEFLPLQKFAYYEPPYQNGLNNWNPYETNYWGYMTTAFFAPETIYSSDGSTQFGYENGTQGFAINELKEVVDTCHREGLTVIMDVVYNHISNYDLNPLRLISENYYLRKNADGSLKSDSGCGNDFATEQTKARKLIIDSVLYWMQEFRIDGFRFDLANLIDRETFAQLSKEAKLLNPQVVLIAEPWGGGYDPAGFSNMGLMAWNDQLRNGIKGSSPDYHKGYIFAEWHHGNDRFALENYLKGTLQGQSNGLFKKSSHSVNYLESHDGYTLGDFIRYATGRLPMGRKLDPKEFMQLTPDELDIAKLAGLFLFCAQGVPMIHAGQEFARSKWNHQIDGIEDLSVFQLSHDSYNRDDETNYIDWEQKKLNNKLFDYYRGLIELRKAHPSLRQSPPEAFKFQAVGNDLIIMVMIDGYIAGDKYDLLLLFNATNQEHIIELPDYDWEEVLNKHRVDLNGNGFIRGSLSVQSKAGYVFRKLRD